MANVFIGYIINNQGENIHEQITPSKETKINVEIYEDSFANNAVIEGLYSWSELKEMADEKFPIWTFIPFEAGNIDARWLKNVLKRP